MVDNNLAYKIQKIEGGINYTYLPEKLKSTSVSLNDIFKNKLRLDANAFNIDAKIAKQKILECKYGHTSITGEKGLSKAYRPGITKRNFVSKKEGVPMYTPSQISEVYPKPHKFLSKEQAEELTDWYLVEGELALTCSGTVGNVSMVSKTLGGKVFSQNMIRLYDSNCLGYIYTFLKTPEGQAIITSNNYGAVIKHIDPNHLDNVIIPDAPDTLKVIIHELIVQSYGFRDKSNELIDKAEQILYNELQLKPIEELEVQHFEESVNFRNYVVRLSDSKLRLDGSFHIPESKAILEHLKKYSSKVNQLKDNNISEKILHPNRFKRVYSNKENGVPFFGGKNLLDLDPSSGKYLALSQHENVINNELRVKENSLIITRSGTIGKVVLTPKHWHDWIGSDDLIRIYPIDNNIAGYIYCWLNSDYGKLLLKRNVYGSVVDHIEVIHTEETEIPILKNEQKQKEINDLVLKANEFRYQAYLKEQEAIEKMKEIINSGSQKDKKQKKGLSDAELIAKYESGSIDLGKQLKTAINKN